MEDFDLDVDTQIKLSKPQQCLRIPRFKKIELQGVLGALNVINISAVFWILNLNYFKLKLGKISYKTLLQVSGMG